MLIPKIVHCMVDLITLMDLYVIMLVERGNWVDVFKDYDLFLGVLFQKVQVEGHQLLFIAHDLKMNEDFDEI